MAKKTKKTAGPEPERKTVADRSTTFREIQGSVRQIAAAQAERALRRAKTWVFLLDELDQILDTAHETVPNGRFVTSAEAAEEVRRNPEQYGIDLWSPESRVAALHRARSQLAAVNRHELTDALQHAANRIPTIEESGDSVDTILDLLCRVENGGSVKYPTRTHASAVAMSIVAVRKLLDADLALAKKHTSLRPPVGIEVEIVATLAASAIALSGEDLAMKLSRKENGRRLVAKGVQDAVTRLRNECGFAIRRAGDAGYVLDDIDRRLAVEHGIVVEVVEG